MATMTYEPSMTMLDARNRYFAINRFGEGGGYDDAWVDFKVGPIPFPFPNTAGRVRAVKVHDLHHIVTGYDTDFCGELEISAWEIGADCKDFFTAWALNLSGMGGGLLIAPRRTYRAFVRGRHAHSLYGESVDDLLRLTVADVRRRADIDAADTAEPTSTDVLLFIASAMAGLAFASVFMVQGLALLPLGLAANYMRQRDTKTTITKPST